MMTDAQREDLERAGLLDREKFREQHGRDVRASEIHDAHLHMRAHASHRVRSTEQLISYVHDRLHGQPRDKQGRFC